MPEAATPEIDVDEINRMKPSAVLVDFDGTLMIGPKVVTGAQRLATAFEGRCAVISNNSSDLPETLAKRLQRSGVNVQPDFVFTAGALLVDELSRRAETAPVLAILSPKMRRYALSVGVTLVDDQAEIVAIGRDLRFDYKKLSRAANAVKHGAQIIAANMDLNHPGPNGTLIPETGAIVAAIKAAVGSSCCIDVLGKPSPHLATVALARLGITDTRDLIIVGDNQETDGALATAIGARFYNVTRSVGPSVALLGYDTGTPLQVGD